jgi:hypothetical protein
MEKEEIAVEKPVTIDEYIIVPIIRKSLHCHKNKEGNIFIGTKHPLAVLVTTGSKKMLHMIEDDVSMEKLIEELPELKNLLLEVITCRDNYYT